MTGQAVFLGKPGFSVSKDCFCFSHRIGLWIKVILSFYFTLMTRNHKSFRDHLCYRFLLWVPNSFGIQGKFLFHTFFTDADRSTSTSSVFEVVWNGEHCKKKKSFLSFLLKIVGTLVLSMLLEKHQDDGPFFFFLRSQWLSWLFCLFLWVTICYQKMEISVLPWQKEPTASVWQHPALFPVLATERTRFLWRLFNKARTHGHLEGHCPDNPVGKCFPTWEQKSQNYSWGSRSSVSVRVPRSRSVQTCQTCRVKAVMAEICRSQHPSSVPPLAATEF